MAIRTRLITPSHIRLSIALIVSLWLSGCTLFGGGPGPTEPTPTPVTGATVSLDPSSGSVGPNEAFAVTLRVHNASDLYGIAARIHYPTDRLELIDIEWMDADDDALRGQGLSWSRTGTKDGRGYVALVRSLTDPVDRVRPARSDGAVVRLHWRPLQAGALSLYIDEDRLSIVNANGVEIRNEWRVEPAEITVRD